jgi:hypothetical protein
VVVEGVLYLPVSPFYVSDIQIDVPRIREAIDRLWSKGWNVNHPYFYSSANPSWRPMVRTAEVPSSTKMNVSSTSAPEPPYIYQLKLVEGDPTYINKAETDIIHHPSVIP